MQADLNHCSNNKQEVLQVHLKLLIQSNFQQLIFKQRTKYFHSNLFE